MDRYSVKRAGLTLLRVGLFTAVLFAVAGVAAGLLWFLGVVTAVGVLSALLDAGPVALLVAGGAGVVGVGLAAAVGYWLVRQAGRLDDRLVEAVGPLDRLSALQRRYVGGEVGEAEFEAELDTLLDAADAPPEARVPRQSSGDGLGAAPDETGSPAGGPGGATADARGGNGDDAGPGRDDEAAPAGDGDAARPDDEEATPAGGGDERPADRAEREVLHER